MPDIKLDDGLYFINIAGSHQLAFVRMDADDSRKPQSTFVHLKIKKIRSRVRIYVQAIGLLFCFRLNIIEFVNHYTVNFSVAFFFDQDFSFQVYKGLWADWY
jgi:hypothetical protein